MLVNPLEQELCRKPADAMISLFSVGGWIHLHVAVSVKEGLL